MSAARLADERVTHAGAGITDDDYIGPAPACRQTAVHAVLAGDLDVVREQRVQRFTGPGRERREDPARDLLAAIGAAVPVERNTTSVS